MVISFILRNIACKVNALEVYKWPIEKDVTKIELVVEIVVTNIDTAVVLDLLLA